MKRVIWHKNKRGESKIERYLRTQLLKIGIRAIKFKDPQRKGAPDRECLGKNRTIFFAETKTEEGKLSPHQIKYHKDLRDCGFEVYVINSFEAVDALIEQYEPA